MVRCESIKLMLNFEPFSNDEEIVSSTLDYVELWKNEGGKIVATFEKVTGLKFTEGEIKVIIYEGISRSGKNENDPLKLRASYSADVKKATLIHELGHRLLFQLENRQQSLDAHQILFLVLYDIWTELYGQEFADKQVAVESSREGIYDYRKTWEWALALGRIGREKMFKQIV